MDVIVTIPRPHFEWVKDVAAHPAVVGARYNTAMYIGEVTPANVGMVLDPIMKAFSGKKLWVDLKGRQLRVKRGTFAMPPWSAVEISHEIELDCSPSKPVKCWFEAGDAPNRIIGVDGNKLLMEAGPRRVVGSGESLNIVDPSFHVKGYLTEEDKVYIAAYAEMGGIHFMASYVEQDSDIMDIFDVWSEHRLPSQPTAYIMAKIESMKGLTWVNTEGEVSKKCSMMAARGDLFIEIQRPDKIIPAMKLIAARDNYTVCASRVLPSLLSHRKPSCSDITDLGFIKECGYKAVMVGDDLCFDKDALLYALDIIAAI